VINTASIERLNTTLCACLAPLARRSRCTLHRPALLTAAMHLVGMAYSYCWAHESLRAQGPYGSGRERTPAMAAGLADRPWTLRELLAYQVPPAPWVAPKRHGRPPKPRPAEAIA